MGFGLRKAQPGGCGTRGSVPRELARESVDFRGCAADEEDHGAGFYTPALRGASEGSRAPAGRLPSPRSPCTVAQVMVATILHGFSPAEARTVASALERTGWTVGNDAHGAACPSELEARLGDLDPQALVVVAARGDREMSALSRCIRLQTQHLYAAGVSVTVDRGPVSALALDLRGRLFFLPAEEGELLRLFRECRSMAREIETRLAIAGGMRRQEIAMDIGTSDLHVAEMAWYVTDRLSDAGFCPDIERRRRTGLALEEALLNAVEHGNLELDSGLRSVDARGGDPYELLRIQRMADARYSSRRVRIGLRVQGDTATVEVDDDGHGIDAGRRDAVGAEDVTGRGMALIRRAFDSVEHEGSTLVMKCRKEQADAAGGS
jgi:anti-sigma regulatory factor (Ser/Thr protein kinase)